MNTTHTVVPATPHIASMETMWCVAGVELTLAILFLLLLNRRPK